MAAGLVPAVLVVGAVLAVPEGSAGDGVYCGTPGCIYAGGCRQPHRVTCDLRNVGRQHVNITFDTFPTSVRQLTIANAASVSLRHLALFHLRRLELLQLLAIDNVTLEKGSALLVMPLAASSPLTVTIDTVRQLSVATIALSDYSRSDHVTLRNIRECYIAGGAFRGSSSPVQSVTLENITSLTLEPGAFNDITRLSISDVTITRCRQDTFAGAMDTVMLHAVTVQRAERDCVRAYRWRSLVISASQLGYVNSGALSGQIADAVILNNTFMRRLDERAVSFNVTRFIALDCSFGELRPRSLQVTASRSVLLQRCAVGTLRRNAFRLLRLKGHDAEGVAIQRLRIDRAESGALRFADSLLGGELRNVSDADESQVDANSSSSVILSSLNFGIPCMCGAWQQASRLLLSNEDTELILNSEGEHPLTESILNARCAGPADAGNPTLAEFELLHCGRAASARRSAGNSLSQYYAAASVPPLLLLLLGALAALLWRRRGSGHPAASDDGAIPAGGDAVSASAPVSVRDSPVTSRARTGGPPARSRGNNVPSEPTWAYIRPMSDFSEGLYAVPDELNIQRGDECSSGSNKPTPELGPPVIVKDALGKAEGLARGEGVAERTNAATEGRSTPTTSRSVYDRVHWPPVAVCTCSARFSESTGDDGSSLYARLCTCRPRRVVAL
ncbi:uncharacterized protein LOC122387422 [Amphibalanus amphitrite]|uniref:uncharacterized protein LOC122387422 n=1 Tax=Amphibalanus amphitrite TaxID=1232801 RepID=UPI001C920609|nr:uncharacterized protein LOC122387422 [Amphibalanus amphitrite]